jgi:predicted DCC family thiol-disulfide oxidoreductase YuxK
MELLEAIGRESNDISSVVLIKSVTEKEAYFKSDAVLNVMNQVDNTPLPIMATVGGTLLPLLARDYAYDVVAANRYNFLGKRDECRCSDPKFSDRFIS